MRVLLVAERFPPQPGGVATSAWRNARALAPALESLAVLHLVDDLPPGASSCREEGGFTVHALGAAAREEDSLQLLELAARGLARSIRARVLHGFYALSAGFVATLAARTLGLPSVVSLRGNDVDRGVFTRTGRLEWTLNRADRVLAVSRALQERVAVFAGRNDSVYTPNAVDPEVFRPGSRAEDLGPDPVVLFSGEMRFKKGLGPLLEAAAALAGEPLQLVLAGGVRRDDRPAFRTWLREHPGARVRELPPSRDPERLRALYGRADLVVLPALFEGMPNAVLEAMACARPVLATRVGGVEDVIEDGRTGWLLEPEDLHRLDRHLQAALARPPGEREALGAAARERVLAGLRLEDERDRLLAVYRELTGPGTRRAGPPRPG